MRTLSYLAGFCLLVSVDLYSQVILTEVMFDPAGSENYDEFLEIYNTSPTDTIDLLGWQIGDQTETDAVLQAPAGAALLLAPLQYAVILDAGYFGNSEHYKDIVPASALVLTIDDAAFGSGGLSNATPETILLISAAGDTVARYEYSPGNTPGHSDEKIILSDNDSPGNWGNALVFNGTPGYGNSVAPLENDLGLGTIDVLPIRPRRGETVHFHVLIFNFGFAQSLQAQLHIGMNSHSEMKTIDYLPIPPIAPGDSLVLEAQWLDPPAGRANLIFTLSGHLDDNAINDTATVRLAVAWPAEIVRLNEIMFAPQAGEAEWLEIYNPTDETISLAGWSVQDESGRPALLPDSMRLAARAYAVIAAARSVQELYHLSDGVFTVASGFPTLNNTGDVVRLLDFSGAVIDSFSYDGAWGGGVGTSLEKIWHERRNAPSNWLPSLAAGGATPGAINSRSPREVDMQAGKLLIQPNRPRAGENVRLLVTGYNRGRSVISSPTITFFVDADGDRRFRDAEKVGEMISPAVLQPEDSLRVSLEITNHPSGHFETAAVWSIAGDVDAANDTSFVVLGVGYAPRRIVINEVLYDSPDGVEWIELFNRSNEAIDLRGWELADSGDQLVFPDTISNFILGPGAFVVLTGDANSISQRHIVLANFPSLNNDYDNLVVRDFSGTVQDSLHYFAAWGGGEGRSLERINPELGSNDSSNWSGCVAANGGTPGAANSIFAPIVPQRTVIDVAPNPFSPDGDGRDDFAIIQFQLPLTTAAVHLKVYDMRGRLVRHLLNNTPTGASYQLVWDGAGDDGESLRMGIYVLFLQALNEQHGIVQETKTTVVLAKQL